MTPEIGICLAILAGAVALFATERLSADIVALGVLLTLFASGLVTAEQAFAGFASDTVMMILGLLIMTASLANTGVVDLAGRAVLDVAGRKPQYLVPAIMGAVALLSAFISNTAATAFFIPVVLGFAKTTRTSPSKYLLPLAFASILTSSVTLISTSTNLVVSQLMTQYRLPAMGMFELAPVGLPIALVGLLYMATIGVRLMPDRKLEPPGADIGRRMYQADVVVLPDAPLIGKTVRQSHIGQRTGLRVVKIIRDGSARKGLRSHTRIRAGDRLVLEGSREDILKVKDLPGVELKADAHLADPEAESHQLAVVEGVLMPQSPLIGRTLRSAEFKDRYGLQVLAINRATGRTAQKLSSIRLRLGDVLLLQGKPENVRALERGNLFNIFGGIEPGRLNLKRAPLAAASFVLVLAAATFKILPLAMAALAGAFLVLLLRCISPEEAYRQVEWKAIILIGALLSLGAAMESSGTAKYLAAQFLPVAIQTALQLGLNPRTFAMMVAVAASCSYLTPLEPSCLMVYGPGHYRFMDFFKVGLPLTGLIFLIAVLLVPWMWPL